MTFAASTPDSKSFTIPNPCDKLSEEVKSKVSAARQRGERMFKPCLVITSKAIYVLKLDEDPVTGTYLQEPTLSRNLNFPSNKAFLYLNKKCDKKLLADLSIFVKFLVQKTLTKNPSYEKNWWEF